MAERVTITIDVDAKTAPIGKTIAQLKALDTAVNRVNSRTGRLSGAINAQNKSLKNLNNNFDNYNKNLSRAYSSSKKFNSVARLLLFTVIGLGIEFGVTALALVSVNAAFNIGKLAVKGYHAAMAGLAGIVAAIGVGLSTAAAAMREYNAATYAFRMKSFPALGSGLNQSMAMMRSLTTDATLASFGVQALSQAFASVSKSSEFTGRSLQTLRALADFAYAGGDPAQNLAAAAEFIGLLQKEGKVTSQVTAAAKAMGPEFEKSFKKLAASGKSAEDVFGMITSGQLAKDAGVFGQAGVVNNTLVGSFKATFTRIQSLFADFGQQFIEPVRKALFIVENIFKRTFLKIGPELQAFGKGPLLRFLTDGTEKILNISIGLFRKYLPLLDGFGGKVSSFVDNFQRSFRQLKDVLEPLRAGGTIVIDTFGKPILEVFRAIGRNVKSFASMAERNKPQFLAFGEALKNIVAAFFDFSDAFKQAFTEALPVINRIIDAVSIVVNLISDLVRNLAKLGTGVAFLSVFGIGAAAMRGRRNSQIRSGRRSANAQAVANQQFYDDNGGFGIPFFPSQSMSQTAAMGQSGFLPFGVMNSRFGRRQSLKYLMANRGAASRSAAVKKYAMQRMSYAGIGAGLAMAELGPRIFGHESSTAMQIGGAVAAFNPLLGAGVGLLGAGMSSRTQKGGAALGTAGGALTGAKLGLMIGSMIPGLNLLGAGIAGAALGALAGGLIGAISGGRAERKLSKQIGGKVKDNFLTSVATALIMGDTGSARDIAGKAAKDAKRYQGLDKAGRLDFIQALGKAKILSPEEVKAASKHLTNFGRGFDENAKAYQAVDPLIKSFENNITMLGSATGMTKAQIMELAHKMDVDLYDPTLKLNDAITQLGAGMVRTTKELRTALRDVLIQSTDVLDKFIQRQDIRDAFSQAGEKFRTGNIADFNTRDFAELLQTGFAFASQETENPIQALMNLENMFGLGGTAFVDPNSPLSRPGMYNRFVSSGGADLLRQVGVKAKQGFGGTLASEIGARLASRGGRFFTGGQQDIETLSGRIAGLSAEEILSLEQRLANFNFSTKERPYQDFLGSLSDNPRLRALFSGLNVDVGKSMAGLSSDPEIQAMQNGILSAIKTGFDTKPEWWETYPVWWKGERAPGTALDSRLDKDGDGVPPDTPTSRLRRTMTKHGIFDSSIAGKRSITSSLRYNNLGSPSSDHATGNAYDLTGQNLGLYATMVKGAGGFAEFHGSASSRHLHVVPPNGPIGDRTTPVKMAPRTQGGSSGSSNVTVNVYGSEGQSVKELARVVIDELNKAQRSAKERR